jgi:hypothetical protein
MYKEIFMRKIKWLLILLVLGVLVITIIVVTRLPKAQPTHEATKTPVNTSGLPDTPSKPFIVGNDQNTINGYLNSMTWQAKENQNKDGRNYSFYQGKFLGWRAEGNNIIVSVDTDKNAGGEKDVVYSAGSFFGVAAVRGDEMQFFTPVSSLETVKKALDKYFQIGDPIKIYTAPEQPFPDGSVFKMVTFR